MHLEEEQLKAVEEMSSLFFSPADISDNLELDQDNSELFLSLIELKQGPVYKAFRRGRLRTEVQLREAVRMAAMNGSSPAQNLMISFFKDSIQ